MSFWAYLLRCANSRYYTGHTDDLERRIAQHESGLIPGYTSRHRPVRLVWSQAFATRDEAKDAETRIKSWSQAKKQALIRGDWIGIGLAAIPRSEMARRTSPSLDAAHPSTSLGIGGTIEETDYPARSRGTGLAQPRRLHGDAPAIILVRPQLAENIGKAARAMLNFGLTDLRLVSPRDGWPNPAAGPAASGADQVLATAGLYETVADATADCTQIYATTVRKRGVTKPVLTPEGAARAIHAQPGRSAILFGPERSGLETHDVALARAILTVPINPDFGSLNLAQAVILVAYEWSKHVPNDVEGRPTLAQPPATDLDPPAPQGELDGMIAQLDAMLDDAGYFFPPDRTPATRRTLRGLLTKPGWTSQEVRTLRGVLTTLARPRQRASKRSSS